MARKKVNTTENDRPKEKNQVDTAPREIPIIRSPCFEKRYVTRVLPFFTEFDVRMTLCNEVMKTDTGWSLVADEMVIMTPTAAKELVLELTDMLKAFEELNGPIKTRPIQRLVTTFTQKE